MKICKRLIGAVSVLGLSLSAQASDLRTNTQLQKEIAADYETNLKDLFLDFHKNPELSFDEKRTSTKLAKELRALGYDVTQGVGRTGVVAVLKKRCWANGYVASRHGRFTRKRR